VAARTRGGAYRINLAPLIEMSVSSAFPRHVRPEFPLQPAQSGIPLLCAKYFRAKHFHSCGAFGTMAALSG